MPFSVFSLSGVQQSAATRITGSSEKPLQQAERANSHHRAKKLRLDESLSGGFLIKFSERLLTFITQFRHSAFVWSFHCPSFSFCLIFTNLSCLYFLRPAQPPQWPLPLGWGKRDCRPPAWGELVRGKALVLVGWRLQVLPPSLPVPLTSPLTLSPSLLCAAEISLSVQEAYILLDICLCLYRSSI